MISGKNWRTDVDWGVEFYYSPSVPGISPAERSELPKEIKEVLDDSPVSRDEVRLFCAANLDILLIGLEKLEETCREARVALVKWQTGEQ